MELYIKDLRIVSPAFTPLERIPKRYTSEGENISPPLEWSGLPLGTQQLALICHDPDAPLTRGFTHWVIYGIPPTISQLAEAGGSKFTEGMNSGDKPGYTGPTPPTRSTSLLFLAIRLGQGTRPQTRSEPRTTP